MATLLVALLLAVRALHGVRMAVDADYHLRHRVPPQLPPFECSTARMRDIAASIRWMALCRPTNRATGLLALTSRHTSNDCARNWMQQLAER